MKSIYLEIFQLNGLKDMLEVPLRGIVVHNTTRPGKTAKSHCRSLKGAISHYRCMTVYQLV